MSTSRTLENELTKLELRWWTKPKSSPKSEIQEEITQETEGFEYESKSSFELGKYNVRGQYLYYETPTRKEGLRQKDKGDGV